MNSVAVFCGSSFGNNELFKQQAYHLGKILASKGIELVYGGAKVGLMGSVANGVLDNGGKAIGVLPYFLQSKEIAHEALTELILVNTMHERKLKIHELADGIIALPGGYGTLDELFEVLTWAQLGLHKKPIGILNIDDFYDDLLIMINKMVSKEFLKKVNQEMLLTSNNIDELLIKMQNYKAPIIEKWITNRTV